MRQNIITIDNLIIYFSTQSPNLSTHRVQRFFKASIRFKKKFCLGPAKSVPQHPSPRYHLRTCSPLSIISIWGTDKNSYAPDLVNKGGGQPIRSQLTEWQKLQLLTCARVHCRDETVKKPLRSFPPLFSLMGFLNLEIKAA